MYIHLPNLPLSLVPVDARSSRVIIGRTIRIKALVSNMKTGVDTLGHCADRMPLTPSSFLWPQPVAASSNFSGLVVSGVS